MKYLLLLFLIISSPQSLLAGLRVSDLFTDHAVLQRGIKVPVWGWAEPGTKVNVEFAGQKVSTVSDGKAYWRVELSSLKANSKGRIMRITSGGNELVFKDILVGEVWLCSGQSNMDYTLRHVCGPSKSGEPYQAAADLNLKMVKSFKDSELRQFAISHTSMSAPQEQVSSQWTLCDKENISNFTATGFWFAKALRERLKVPVGIIKSAWSGTAIEPWLPIEAYESDTELKKYYKKLAARAASEKSRVTALYNGMIHPLIPYGIKGAIWYQGESNHGWPDLYEKLFTAMIKSWRQNWGQGQFPFYYVQLAGYEKANRAHNWPVLCDKQRLTLKNLPNLGMAVTNDIGEPTDIHPRNKRDVGQRLANWALVKDYGMKDVVVSGPLFTEAKRKSKGVLVQFDHVAKGLLVAQKPSILDLAKKLKSKAVMGFELQDKKGVWHAAEAKIDKSKSIYVWHEKITKVQAIRYAWKAYSSDLNLYNSAGLPASCFTSQVK